MAKSSILRDREPDRSGAAASGGRSGPEPGDAELVAAALAGRRDAYGILVRRYQDGFFRYAERMTGTADDAADIVQVAFVRGFRGLRRCREPERVGGWLFRIVVNLCKDHAKSRHRRDVRLEAVSEVRSERGDPEESARRSEIRGEIERALQELGPEQREAFVLKHVEGWSYEDMSEALGVSVSALKMRVHRAREELKELLRRYR
ncbi:MAG: RNA polymerase sigma factor [Gemmatimonadota bacterium]